MTEIIRLSGPGDLLTSLPYSIGFHPKHSILVACLHGMRLGLIQRIDIPPNQHVKQAMAAMMVPLLREKPTSVLLVGYEDTEGESTFMLDALASKIERTRIEVDAVLMVRNGRWYNANCQSSCCPPEGTPLVLRDAVAAEFIAQGANPQESREAVASRLEPTSLTADNVSHLSDESWVDELVELSWTKILTVGSPTLQQISHVASSLYCIEFRDALIAHLCPGTLDMSLVSPQMQAILGRLPVAPERILIDRLIDMCAKLQDADAAPMATVLGVYAWHKGDGAIARLAVERALRCDPSYRLAQLLERMIDLAVRTVKEPV